MSKLSAALKSARTQAGLTQEALAKRAGGGLTAAIISRAERGEAKPTTEQLKKIAVASGVTQASLLNAAKEATASSKQTAKKAVKTTGTAKKTLAASETSLRLTAAEKKLVLAWRKASDDNQKAALNLLTGAQDADTKDGGLLGSLLSSGASGLGDLVDDLMNKLGK